MYRSGRRMYRDQRSIDCHQSQYPNQSRKTKSRYAQEWLDRHTDQLGDNSAAIVGKGVVTDRSCAAITISASCQPVTACRESEAIYAAKGAEWSEIYRRTLARKHRILNRDVVALNHNAIGQICAVLSDKS